MQLFINKARDSIAILQLYAHLETDTLYWCYMDAIVMNQIKTLFFIQKHAFFHFYRFISHAPKLQRGLIEMSRYFLEQLSLVFPKINVSYQPIPQTIKCHVNIMKYGSSTYMTHMHICTAFDKSNFSLLKSNFDVDIYDVGSMDDSMYKQHEANLNLTLKYNDP